MPVIRKVQSKVTLIPKKEGMVKKDAEPVLGGDKIGKEEGLVKKAGRSKRVCFFCQKKVEPGYYDAVTLRRFISDRGRIIPRGRAGTCAKHQRRVSREIKRARFLALIPFTIRL